MSVKVSAWVWHETGPEVKGNDLIVLLALADVANDAGVCRYFESEQDGTIDALAVKSRMHRSTFIRCVGRLEELGVLQTHRRGPRPTSYRIVMEKTSQNATSRVAECDVYSRTGATSSEVTPLIGRIDVSSPSSKEASKKKRKKFTYSEVFERFWKAYPRKEGKADAFKVFEEALAEGIAPEMIIAGAERFAADPNLPNPDPKSDERQWIPHPTTWLNRGRWDDDPLPAREQAPQRGYDSTGWLS